MRHGWRSSWSGVRTPVRLSVQGPVGEAPATAPFSIPLHHRYRRCFGWRVSSSFFFVQLHGMLRLAVLSLKAGSQKKKKAKPQPPHTCSSALHHRGRLRRRNRISSSYSSSARTRTHVLRAAAGCFAVVVHGPKDHIVHLSLRNAFTERMVCNGGWACGPLTATLTPQSVLSNE